MDDEQAVVDLTQALVKKLQEKLNTDKAFINNILPNESINNYVKRLQEAIQNVNIKTVGKIVIELVAHFKEGSINKVVKNIQEEASATVDLPTKITADMPEDKSKILADEMERAERAAQLFTDEQKKVAPELENIENKWKSIKDKITQITHSNWTKAGFAIGLAGTMMRTISGAMKDINKEFGFGLTNLNTYVKSTITGYKSILKINPFLILDKSGVEATKALQQEFGVLNKATGTQIALTTKLISYYNLSAQEAATLTRLSGENLESVVSTVEEMANLRGVAPTKVFKDLAASAESFATWTQKGSKNVIAASIAARELGLEFSDVTGIADNLLDIEGSIQKEMEASVLIGKQLNFTDARRLALAGDLDGMMKSMVNQLGGINEFEKLNVIQRKALADSMGISVDKLQKMYQQQAQLNNISGSFNKFWNDVGKAIESSGEKLGKFLQKAGGLTAVAGNLAQVQLAANKDGTAFNKLTAFIGKTIHGVKSLITKFFGWIAVRKAKETAEVTSNMEEMISKKAKDSAEIVGNKAVQQSYTELAVAKKAANSGGAAMAISFGQLAGATLVILAFATAVWTLSKSLKSFAENKEGIAPMIATILALGVAVVGVGSLISAAAAPMAVAAIIILAFGAAVSMAGFGAKLMAEGLEIMSNSMETLAKYLYVLPAMAIGITIFGAAILQSSIMMTTAIVPMISAIGTLALLGSIATFTGLRLTVLSTAINIITTSLTTLASSADGLDRVAVSLANISTNLTKIALAGTLALPIVGTITAVNKFVDSEATTIAAPSDNNNKVTAEAKISDDEKFSELLNKMDEIANIYINREFEVKISPAGWAKLVAKNAKRG